MVILLVVWYGVNVATNSNYELHLKVVHLKVAPKYRCMAPSSQFLSLGTKYIISTSYFPNIATALGSKLATLSLEAYTTD